MKCRGFTLVEVLISLALMGSLAVLVVFTMTMGLRINEDVFELIEERGGGSKLMSLMRRDFRGLVILPDATPLEAREDDDGRMVVNFVSSGRLSTDDRGVVAPYSECGYAARPSKVNSSALALYRRHQWFVDDEPLRGGVWELVSDRIKDYSFEFADAETTFTRVWPDGKVPIQVRLIVDLIPQDVDLESLGLDPEGWPVERFEETLSIR